MPTRPIAHPDCPQEMDFWAWKMGPMMAALGNWGSHWLHFLRTFVVASPCVRHLIEPGYHQSDHLFQLDVLYGE